MEAGVLVLGQAQMATHMLHRCVYNYVLYVPAILNSYNTLTHK